MFVWTAFDRQCAFLHHSSGRGLLLLFAGTLAFGQVRVQDYGQAADAWNKAELLSAGTGFFSMCVGALAVAAGLALLLLIVQTRVGRAEGMLRPGASYLGLLREVELASLRRLMESLQTAEFSQKLTATAMGVFNAIVSHLPPTPAKFHYVFNLRDLSRVFQGVFAAPPAKVLDSSLTLRPLVLAP